MENGQNPLSPQQQEPQIEIVMKGWLLEYFKTQGGTVFLLALAVWYFHTQYSEIRKEATACAAEQKELLIKQNAHLSDVIRANTDAINDFKAHFINETPQQKKQFRPAGTARSSRGGAILGSIR